MCFFQENLAFGKLTYQYLNKYKTGRSSKAVDGNSNTNFMGGAEKGSCTMTQRSVNVAPWWRVELQQVHLVSEVYIVSRGSECVPSFLGRFKNFEITVGRWIDLLIYSISSNLSLLHSLSCTVFSWMNVPVLFSNLPYCSTIMIWRVSI